MTEDEPPVVPVHQLVKYAISRIPKPGDPSPKELDADDDEIMDLYEQWMKDLSNLKNWEASQGGGGLQGL